MFGFFSMLSCLCVLIRATPIWLFTVSDALGPFTLSVAWCVWWFPFFDQGNLERRADSLTSLSLLHPFSQWSVACLGAFLHSLLHLLWCPLWIHIDWTWAVLPLPTIRLVLEGSNSVLRAAGLFAPLFHLEIDRIPCFAVVVPYSWTS